MALARQLTSSVSLKGKGSRRNRLHSSGLVSSREPARVESGEYLSLTKVGLATIVVITNAHAADDIDWFGQHLAGTFARDSQTPAFDNGTRRNPFVVSMDFIIHY